MPLPRLSRVALAAAASCAIIGATAAAPATPPGYALIRQITGPDGGWDYTSFDPADRTVYVAHDDKVLAIAIGRHDRATSFGTIAHAHAVVPITGTRLLLVTSGKDDSVRLFDTASRQQIATIPVGSDPDGAVYDPARRIAAVMNAKSGTASIIDVAAHKVARTITLMPGLEFPQITPDGRLFVNNEDQNVIETADVATGKIGPTIALAGCTGPSGLGYDARTHQLISACDNGKAAVVDTRTMKVTRLLDIGDGPDAVIMDSAHRRAYVPCGGSGVLTVVALDGPGGAHVIGTIATAKGARTGAIDPATGTMYLPTATPMTPPPGEHHAYRPGTFRVLVVSKR
jgi:YVTN family beta-propeller protein